jgi:uncharacterized protein YndB with AHSA1/START domain
MTMVDILHRIGVENSSPEAVYEALSTIEGLAGWWAEQTSGDTEPGGVIQFRFKPGGIDMQVAKLDPGRLVRWDVVDGPQEWFGTSVQFDIRQDGDWTIVLFRHEGWQEPVEFMHHCSTKWATFLLSLKQLLETGTGAPEPRDVQISDWH